ncbi:MAG TPA: metallophosphoesterase family protein [Xanthobacteraceae bacterium]|nr:metallophosphoesterase family protein [Xanthobacteraceae bacterium]
MSKINLRLGVISDTHGLLRPEAIAALRGCDLIIHAGDVGSAAVLDGLRDIAPTVAIRGNVDIGTWADHLPPTDIVEVGELMFYLLHNIADLDLDPPTAGFAAVVFGHSHRPSIETRDGVLYLNPGSAGPRRFSLPMSLARVMVAGRELKPEIVELGQR